MKLNFDLDGTSNKEKKIEDTEVPSLEESRVSLEEARKWEIDTLPIKITDSDGNLKYTMKTLESITADEFISWMNEVLPLSEADLAQFIGFKNNREKLNNLKFRRQVFQGIVNMHEKRWVFGLGKDRLPKDLSSN